MRRFSGRRRSRYRQFARTSGFCSTAADGSSGNSGSARASTSRRSMSTSRPPARTTGLSTTRPSIVTADSRVSVVIVWLMPAFAAGLPTVASAHASDGDDPDAAEPIEQPESFHLGLAAGGGYEHLQPSVRRLAFRHAEPLRGEDKDQALKALTDSHARDTLSG